MKQHYIIVVDGHFFQNIELFYGTESEVLKIKEKIQKEHKLHENHMLLIGPISEKEKAEHILNQLSDKKRKRSYYLILSDEEYFVEHGTLKENYFNLQILDFNINKFEFIGPFKREWEAYAHLKKLEMQENVMEKQ